MKPITVILFVSALLLVLIGPARADKSYRVTVSNVSKAGSVELQPGDYHLVLDNAKGRFRELKSGKEFDVEAKIDDSAVEKFEQTAVHSRQGEGTMLISEIRLGGTKTKVVFR